MGDIDEPRAAFSAMDNSTREDWMIIAAAMAPFQQALPDWVLAHLRLLDGDHTGFPIDRPPQVHPPAADPADHLIEMPTGDGAGRRRFSRRAIWGRT